MSSNSVKYSYEFIAQEAEQDIKKVKDEQALEGFRIKFLGKKGFIQSLYSTLASLSPEQRPSVGKLTNELRDKITCLFEEKKFELKRQRDEASKTTIDVTLPGILPSVGHKHLLTQIIEEISSIFERLGFSLMEGPEIETEFNNFTALNIPSEHPSRDGFDTFYLEVPDPQNPKSNLLLRSHTSPGQIRIMKEYKPPLAVVIPGKVFRPDAVDAGHSFMFHQIEGLLVDQDVKFTDLKGLLNNFCRQLFGNDIKMRFRPHYFPFTEPSAEVDISWEGGKRGWLEIMGCGMVHPQVFKAVGYPKGKYTGLAFGLGVERMAMIKYGIKDIRIFFQNDNRFLKQF